MDESTIFGELTKITATLEQNSLLLKRVDKCLYGNGRSGLIERMDRVEERQQNQSVFCDKHLRHQRWIVTTLIAFTVMFLAIIGVLI